MERPLIGRKGNRVPDHMVAGLRLLGLRLRQARYSRGWTQRRLEQVSGVDKPTISRLENGRLANFHITRLGALAMALGGHFDVGHQLHPGCSLLATALWDDATRDDVPHA